MRVFERLSERSRRLRFNGPKPCLRAAELRELASVDAFRHVLVAHVEGDEHAVGIARFVREGELSFSIPEEASRRFATAHGFRHTNATGTPGVDPRTVEPRSAPPRRRPVPSRLAGATKGV